MNFGADISSFGSWIHVQLRYLFTIVSGATPDSNEPNYWDGDILWVTPEDIGDLDGYRLYDTRRKLTTEGYKNCGAKLVPAGSIVLTKRAPIGQLAILEREACSNQGCFLLIPKEEVEARFYYYLLHSKTDYLQILGRGSTFMELSTDDLKGLQVPVPPFTEQQGVADLLDQETLQIDTLITEKKKLITLLLEKRRSLITNAVTLGVIQDTPLRDSGLPWLGEIPEHWLVERAKYLFKQSSLPVREEDEMVTCFRDGQVTLRKNRREEGFTNAILELGYQGIRAGQLVLHSMDAFAGAIGVSDSDGKCSPEYIVCDPTSEEIVNDYYGHLLRTMALSGFIQASCPAVRERAPRIRFNDFGEMFFPVPPPDEQRAIVEHIETETQKLDDLRAETERTIGLLKERRAALIAAAVTGQLDVRVQS